MEELQVYRLLRVQYQGQIQVDKDSKVERVEQAEQADHIGNMAYQSLEIGSVMVR